MRIPANLTANITAPYHKAGTFFFLESIQGGLLTIKFFKNQRQLTEEIEQTNSQGWRVKNGGGFDLVELTSTINQIAVFHVGRGEIDVNVFSGAVTVTNATENGAHVPTAVAVTNADIQLKAANAARKFLSVQNQHATANLFVRGDGVAATATPVCMKIAPGQLWEPKVPPTGEVRGIMDAATAGNTVNVIEA